MPEIISDDMLAEFAVIAPQEDLANALKGRYREIADRITIYIPFFPGERDSFWRDLIDAW
jgi:hypothetical protein